MILLFIVGVFSGYFWDKKKPISPGVKITQIEGDEIKHKEFKINKKSLSFISESKGVGKAKTVLPRPQEWQIKENIVILNMSAGTVYGMQALYYKNFGRLGVGGGIYCSSKLDVNIQVGAMYMF